MTRSTLLLLASLTLPASPIASAASRVPAAPSDTALSVFLEPVPGHCTWLRIDPVQARRERIAEFPLGCTGVSAAWSPDRTRAIVEFPGEWEPEKGRLRHAWIVELASLPATMRPLSLPRAGMLDAIGFDEDGAPLAIFLDSPADPALRDDRTLTYEGQRFEVPRALPGMPALAHAFRWERDRWTRVETVATTSEACDTPGTRLLAASDRIATTTARLLDPALGHELSTEPIGADLFERLESYERMDAESTYAWVRLETSRSAVLAIEGSYSYPFLTTPVLLVDDDGVRELGGMSENAVLAAASRGRYLLLSEAVSGARPLLYDLDGGRLLFSTDDAHAATFWP